MTLPEAKDELAGAGLKLGAWNEIPDYEVPVGTVVVQGPEAGEGVEPDTPVDLIVSAASPVHGLEVPAGNTGDGVGTGQYPGVNPLPPNEAAAFPPGRFSRSGHLSSWKGIWVQSQSRTRVLYRRYSSPKMRSR